MPLCWLAPRCWVRGSARVCQGPAAKKAAVNIRSEMRHAAAKRGKRRKWSSDERLSSEQEARRMRIVTSKRSGSWRNASGTCDEEARPAREKAEVGRAGPRRAVAEAEEGARSRSNGRRLDLHREKGRLIPVQALIGWQWLGRAMYAVFKFAAWPATPPSLPPRCPPRPPTHDARRLGCPAARSPCSLLAAHTHHTSTTHLLRSPSGELLSHAP